MIRAEGHSPQNRDHGIDAIHHRHLQVHEGDIRTMGSELVDRLAAIGSLSNQFQIGLNGQQRGHTLAEEGMVVDREDANRSAASVHQSLPSLRIGSEPPPPAGRTVGNGTRNAQFHLCTRSDFAPQTELRADLLGALAHTH